MENKKNIALMSATSGNNLELIKKIAPLIEQKQADISLINLEELDLPLYTPAREEQGVPQKAKTLSKKLQQSDALVLSAPEYNGSIPPVMTNAISWISRSGDDWRVSFNEKIGIVATHSGGGGDKVCSAMRSQLEHLGCFVHPRNIVTNYSKPFKEESVQKIIDGLFKYLD